jgi:hypothetical protein
MLTSYIQGNSLAFRLFSSRCCSTALLKRVGPSFSR